MKTDPNNGFTYYPDVFDAVETYLNLRARFEKETNGFGKWMLGRRASEQRQNVLAQENHLHHVVVATETENICVCGLQFERAPWTDETQAVRVDGHWDHTTESLAQVYVWKRRLVCAGCDLDAEVQFDEHDLPLVDWDAALAEHAECGFLGN